MKQNSLNTRNSKGRLRTRLGTKVLSITAAFALAVAVTAAAEPERASANVIDLSRFL